MSNRYSREQEFFDKKAKRRIGAVPADRLLPTLRLDAGVTRGSAQDYAIGLLSDCAGRQLLDIGAGEGWASLHFASLGADVTATEVSGAALEVLRNRAAALGLENHIRTVKVENDKLPFEGGTFDIVFSNAVLHHLDLAVAMTEIHRVLKAGGIAVFMEPLANHPLVRIFRRLTPRGRTRDERPLSWEDLPRITKLFKREEARFFELVGLPTLALRHTPIGPHLSFLHKIDSWLFRVAPRTRHYSRAVVLRLEK
jgi:SAM-dependent methyltransferase